MFLEPAFKNQRSGWIEVICGSMFSGKTEELIRRLKRAKFANQTVIIYKPQVDDRYADDKVVSHDSNAIESQSIKIPEELFQVGDKVDVIGIDEAQFFDKSLTKICEHLAIRGKRIIIAGLDMDYKGEPFGPMPDLLAIAEYITKVHAICPHCGNLATHTYRTIDSDKRVLVGEKEAYEPRCRMCYAMGNILDFRNK